ncbi:hypothetical protein WJX75_005067 [Coccomyxa subellipsoidea]|uniref:Secreted protein n=1 Tax=Coccomyxa subellipsoidea TaxID=248742 RepID=A0ABR2YPI7_9CHLO
MRAIRSTAVLLLCLVITDIITHQSVQARFRGAQPKQIPSLAADGGLVNPNAGATVQRKDANVPKGVRRTKGGLLPWWIVQLARDDREEVSGGVDIGMVESGDSAIVVKDLPMEDGADQGADDRLAAFDSQMGILAENAKIEELSRGSGAEPDLLMDDAVKQAVQEHEDAAVKTGLQWPEDPQQKDGGSGQDDNEDREIVMTDVSKAERQAEQLSAMADPGDSDNFEEGLLSAAADEDAASDAAASGGQSSACTYQWVLKTEATVHL